jgi:hypothetical protein
MRRRHDRLTGVQIPALKLELWVGNGSYLVSVSILPGQSLGLLLLLLLELRWRLGSWLRLRRRVLLMLELRLRLMVLLLKLWRRLRRALLLLHTRRRLLKLMLLLMHHHHMGWHPLLRTWGKPWLALVMMRRLLGEEPLLRHSRAW